MSLNWGKIYSTNNRIDRVRRDRNPPTLRMTIVREWDQTILKQEPFPYQREGKFWVHEENGKQVFEDYEPEYEMKISVQSKGLYNK